MSGIGGKGLKATAAPAADSEKESSTRSRSPCLFVERRLGKVRAEKGKLETCTVSKGICFSKFNVQKFVTLCLTDTKIRWSQFGKIQDSRSVARYLCRLCEPILHALTCSCHVGDHRPLRTSLAQRGQQLEGHGRRCSSQLHHPERH